MRSCLLVACMATAVLVPAARGGEPVDRPVEEPEPAKTNWSLVDGVPMPTMGGIQFWGDELCFHGWRIQRNVLTGHCRDCERRFESETLETPCPGCGGFSIEWDGDLDTHVISVDIDD